MNPVYIDLHIHTSEDPCKPNTNYDLEFLKKKIEEISQGSPYLISFTDHNFINGPIYLNAIKNGMQVLLGVELHVEYDSRKEPYHCHMYFNVENINKETIDKINAKLDKLYPKKVISFGDTGIPHLESIVNEFDEYDFLLLPHGGQSHHTFDKAIPDGTRFDSTIERSIYYNQFDGFTARSNQGLEETQEYFSRLGINEFVNLVTSTDNYNPVKYPQAKDSDAKPFIPTWMFSEASFSGLRLSLSESSRLQYGEKPKKWSEYIQRVSLTNDNVDIDVNLSPGLNVVIGDSSSGKTLFVDSIYRKAKGDFEESPYIKFGVDQILVYNPAGTLPHYISQNYIVQIVNETEGKTIDTLEIIRNIFPGDNSITEKIRENLKCLKEDVDSLISSVRKYEVAEKELLRIPVLGRLILGKKNSTNLYKKLLPDQNQQKELEYPEYEYDKHKRYLLELEEFFKNNAFVSYKPDLFINIKKQLDIAYSGSLLESKIRDIITSYRDEVDAALSAEDAEHQSKIANYEKLLIQISDYSNALYDFYKVLHKISNYSFKCQTQEIQSMGHTLYIENEFEINPDILRDAFNKYIRDENRVADISELTPSNLFQDSFLKRPKVNDYSDYASKVYSELETRNHIKYRIKTNNGKDFQDLSAGWKTSVLLDLILGYRADSAPLIIDQPEDNLATSYINKGLIHAIKTIKEVKQVIIVSHNATIPMLGDAQRVILCQNISNKIVIKSASLEGTLQEKTVVDHIADITDGGKASIKKRVKKYNLKSFRG